MIRVSKLHEPGPLFRNIFAHEKFEIKLMMNAVQMDQRTYYSRDSQNSEEGTRDSYEYDQLKNTHTRSWHASQ